MDILCVRDCLLNKKNNGAALWLHNPFVQILRGDRGVNHVCTAVEQHMGVLLPPFELLEAKGCVEWRPVERSKQMCETLNMAINQMYCWKWWRSVWDSHIMLMRINRGRGSHSIKKLAEY